MVPGVYRVAGSVYLAYDYALTSSTIVVGDDGVIIVDPPEDVTTERVAFKELRKFSDEPVKAVTDLAAPDLLHTFPTSELVNGMRFRLQAENTLDVRLTLGLRLPDVDEGYGLEIRRGAAQYHDSLPPLTVR